MQTSVARRRWTLLILTLILALIYSDRLALGIALQGIKADLGLSDTQLGVLSGIAFAFFYATMGIPIARWADRGNRVLIIVITTVLWGIGVALCGVPSGFWQLVLIRAGVAVGEAGAVPAGVSLVSDQHTRSERPKAVATYMLGVPLSLVIGFLWAGWLNQVLGWRLMFISLGAPGVLLALIAWVTIRDPQRAGAELAREEPRRPEGTWRVFWRSRTYRNLLLAWSLVFFFNYGVLQWQPAFFVRSYHLDTGEIGTWFGCVYGLGGFIGTYLGGVVASRYASDDESLQLKLTALMFSAGGVFLAATYVCPNQYWGFLFVGLSTIAVTGTNGSFLSILQAIVPPDMRATSIAVALMFANLIGLGLGPVAAGALSDHLAPIAGAESLRYALLMLCPGFLWGAWHTWRASLTVNRDLVSPRDTDSHDVAANIAVSIAE